MSAGTITDPKFNKTEEDYGILIEGETGHYYPYFKDSISQYLTHSTPVEFDLIDIQVTFSGKSTFTKTFKVQFAVIQSVKPDIGQHSAAYVFNDHARTSGWNGKKATAKDFELHPNIDLNTKSI